MLCDNNHEEICFEVPFCPICKGEEHEPYIQMGGGIVGTDFFYTDDLKGKIVNLTTGPGTYALHIDGQPALIKPHPLTKKFDEIMKNGYFKTTSGEVVRIYLAGFYLNNRFNFDLVEPATLEEYEARGKP